MEVYRESARMTAKLIHDKGTEDTEELINRRCPCAAEPQPNPYIRSDFTEGNEGNEGPGRKLWLFVSFCKISWF